MTVVEKNSFAGGRCSIIQKDGFRFDQGPSLLLLPGLFRETFVDLDTTIEAAGVELLQCMPNYHIWFHDGELFRSSTDTAAMKAEIERWEGPDGFRRYLAWLAEAHSHYHLSLRHVLHRNFTSILQLANPRVAWAALSLHPLESIWSRAGRYFHSERLRRVFTFATMYMGMSPYDAPSTYSLLQYAELAEGIWYPRGGFYGVLHALKTLGEGLGVKYRMDAPVRRILTQAGQASGVELETGERIEADVVVVNADLVYAYSQLLPQGPQTADYAASLRERPTSCSSISFYWSFRKKVPQLGSHNIFLAEAYKDSFDAIFKRHDLPDCPSFYINVPSRIDPTAAPEGQDAVIALVPVGHLFASSGDDETQEERDWPALVAKARKAVLETIEARTKCEPLAPLIVDEVVNDPRAWETKFNLDKGAILGLSHNFANVLAFRPPTRAADVAGGPRFWEPRPRAATNKGRNKTDNTSTEVGGPPRNTYFVGASTHPGTGVPIVLAGAKITAEQVLGDLGMAIPWTPAVEQAARDAGAGPGGNNGRSPHLDRLRAPWWVSDANLAVTAVFALLVALLLFSSGATSQGTFLGRWIL